MNVIPLKIRKKSEKFNILKFWETESLNLKSTNSASILNQNGRPNFSKFSNLKFAFVWPPLHPTILVYMLVKCAQSNRHIPQSSNWQVTTLLLVFCCGSNGTTATGCHLFVVLKLKGGFYIILNKIIELNPHTWEFEKRMRRIFFTNHVKKSEKSF